MSFFSGLFGLMGTTLTNDYNTSNTEATNRANLQQVQETNKANLQIARETNESNERIMKQTNEFNAAQADLAYQRSTSSAKVAELIAAGMTPQQARQIVAGGGITSTATPASGTALPAQGATMQPPHFEKAQLADYGQSLSQLGAGVDSFFNQYISSFADPTGGVVGALQANDMFEKVSSHISELPFNVLSTPYNFETYLQSQTDGFWYDLRNSNEFKDMWSKPLGRRSFLYQMSQVYGDSASKQNDLDYQELQIRLAELQEINDQLQNKFTLQEIENLIKTGRKIEAETEKIGAETGKIGAEVGKINAETEGIQIANKRAGIVLERDQKTANLVTQSEIWRLKNAIADSKLQNKLLTNPTYMEAYFGAALNNQLWQCALNAYSARKAEAQNNYLIENPDDELSLAIFQLLDSVGFEHTQLCQDLKENYLAGSSMADFMLKRSYTTNKFGVKVPKSKQTANDLYYSLEPLWKKRYYLQPKEFAKPVSFDTK